MGAFLIFAGSHYYPGGGWNDFAGDASTLDEAKEKLMRMNFEWAHVIDTSNGESVYSVNRN